MPVDSRQGDLATSGGLAAIVLWSTTVALARSLSEQIGPLTAAAAVYLIGGGLCLLRFGWTKTSWRRLLGLPRLYLLGCGSLFVLYTVLLFLAVGLARDREQALEVGLINYLWPALTVLFSLWLLNKRAGLFLWSGTGLALAGVFLVMTHDTRVSWQSFIDHLESNPVAYVLALLAAISWALYSNLTRRWSRPGSDGAAEWFIPATGLVLLLIRFFRPEPGSWNAQAVWEAGFLGVCTALAYGFWDLAMRKGNLVLVMACSYFTPLLSTLVSCSYLKVFPGLQLWIGCLLIVGGSVITRRSISDREREGMVRVAQ